MNTDIFCEHVSSRVVDGIMHCPICKIDVGWECPDCGCDILYNEGEMWDETMGGFYYECPVCDAKRPT